VVAAAKLKVEDHLEFKVARPGVIQILTAKPQGSISQLVRGITPQNCPAHTDWGEPVGYELL